MELIKIILRVMSFPITLGKVFLIENEELVVLKWKKTMRIITGQNISIGRLNGSRKVRMVNSLKSKTSTGRCAA